MRDTLLGLEVKDIDVATPLEPAEVIARLDAARHPQRPDRDRARHDHRVLARAARSRSPRCAMTSATDGRRATVAFASDWREDAARRDFTINALYADPGDAGE